MKLFIYPLLLSSSLIALTCYAAPSDTEMSDAPERSSVTRLVDPRSECADGNRDQAREREARARNANLAEGNAAVARQPDPDRKRTSSDAQLDTSSEPPTSRHRPDDSASFLAQLPAGVDARLLDYLSVGELKAYRLVERKTHEQVRNYAAKAVEQVTQSWTQAPESKLSGKRHEQLFEIITKLAFSHPHSNDTVKQRSYLQAHFEDKGCLIVPKGVDYENVKTQLRDVDGRRVVPQLFSSFLTEDMKQSLLGFFNENIQSERLQKAALEHALSTLRVFGNPNAEVDFIQVAEAVLKENAAHYIDLANLPEGVRTDDQPYNIVLTLEELQEGHSKDIIEEWFGKDSPHTLFIDVNQEQLEDIAAHLPTGLTRLVLTNANKNLLTIGNLFLLRCTSLTSFDSSGLTALQTIGNFFLHGCSSLTSFDSSGLTALQTIGDSFLYECESLTSFDSSGLTALQTIGDYFLLRCTSLTSFDSSGLTALQTIGDYFLLKCTSLKSFDSSGLTALQTIGDGFLELCSSLTSFDSSGLTALQTIGDAFLRQCESLRSFDSSGLTALQTIGNGFLHECSSLRSFDSSGLTALQTIGNGFLYGCGSLESFDSSGLTALQTIGHNFLGECTSLTSFDSLGLTALQTIGNNFLCYCTSLTSFDSSGLTALQTIGDYFLHECSSLRSFDSSGLTALQTIGDDFLRQCESLTSFDSSGLVSLENLKPESFLHLCANLNSFSSSGLCANVILELSSKGSNFIKEAIRRELEGDSIAL